MLLFWITDCRNNLQSDRKIVFWDCVYLIIIYYLYLKGLSMQLFSSWRWSTVLAQLLICCVYKIAKSSHFTCIKRFQIVWPSTKELHGFADSKPVEVTSIFKNDHNRIVKQESLGDDLTKNYICVHSNAGVQVWHAYISCLAPPGGAFWPKW